MAFTDDKFPEMLIENFKEKLGVFFIGAGLSIEAGLPSWGQLISDLVGIAKTLPWIHQDKIDDYEKLMKEGDKFLLLAEDLKSELGEEFYKHIDKVFGQPDIKPTKTSLKLFEFDTKMMITSNYDMILENSFIKVKGYQPPTFKYNQSREIANNFWKEKFFILKAHGDAYSDVQGIILSQKDYRKTLYKQLGYKSILQSIFSTKSIFFIGTSMSDPEFNLLLDYLHESYHGGGPTHYLLISEDKAMPTLQKRYLEDFNIQSITYKNNSGNHAEILEYLTELEDKVK